MVAFAIAFILHVLGHGGTGKVVTDAEILGWLCIAAHLAFGAYVTVWPRRRSGDGSA